MLQLQTAWETDHVLPSVETRR